MTNMTIEKRIVWNKGLKLSEEHKNNISQSRKGQGVGKDNSFYGQHHSPETIKKILEKRAWYKGSDISKEAHRKISESNKGKKREGQAKENLRIANLNRIGEKRSEEAKQKMRESKLKLWQNPEYKQRMIDAHKGQISWNKGEPMKEETKLKLSKSLKGRPSWNKNISCSEETKRKLSEALKGRVGPNLGRKFTEEQRKRISDGHKGQKAWNKGKPISTTTKEKLSRALKGKIPWNKGIPVSEESKKKNSESQKNIWLNFTPQEKEEHLKKYFSSLEIRPTSYEKKIIELCNKHNLSFKYVGNGEVIIGYKNPDFIETNGKKLLIEVYHDYFKRKGNEYYEEKRSLLFSKYGYKTLFLKDEDIERKDWEEICLNKIKLFMGD